VVDCYEHGNEPLVSIEVEGFLDHLINCEILEKDSVL